MLIIVKKIWCYDTIVVPKNGRARILFRVEAFLKTNEGYAPYAYLDTLITSPASVVHLARYTLPWLFAVLVKRLFRWMKQQY